jgi:voltage-gated potassium channel Kch
LFKLKRDQNALFTFALAQGGEFAFVLLAFALQQRVLTPEITGSLVVAVAISMALTPILLVLNERLVQPALIKGINQRSEDEIDENENPVILAGFGRVGHVVGRFLRYNGIGTTVLDFDADQVETFRQFGIKSFYGDASREEMLRAAGLEKAKLFVLAIDDREKSLQIVKVVQKEFPHVEILARAIDLEHHYELITLGVKKIYRETFGSAMEMGVDALRFCGFRATQAHRAAHLFRLGEESNLAEIFHVWNDDAAIVSKVRHQMENLEALLHRDSQRQSAPDGRWDVGNLIRDIAAMQKDQSDHPAKEPSASVLERS